MCFIPSAHRLPHNAPVSATPTHMLRICVNPRHPLFSGRADNACTNLLGFFVWYVRTRGSMRLRRAQNHRFSLRPLSHALATHYFLRLTRARRQWFGRRTAWVLLADFLYFSSQKSTIKELLLSFYNLKENKSKFVPTFSTRRACAFWKLFRVLRKRI